MPEQTYPYALELDETETYRLLTGQDITAKLSQTNTELDFSFVNKGSINQGYLTAKQFQIYCLRNNNEQFYRSCFLDVDSSFREQNPEKLVKALQRLAETIHYQKNN